MKLTVSGCVRSAAWVAICAAMMWLAGMTAQAQAVSTTTVQGTVYLATGQTAGGTLAVSWPAFTTAAGELVAAGKTTVAVGADGFVSVNLAPNLGATPAGEYYTAIFYMSDGSVNTQYWVVPAAAQASLAQVQAQVMPAAQAVQAVNKAYVDQAVSQALSSQITASGGNLTGPLYLSGDPTQPLQAADKHYVDSSFSAALPLTGGAATGPLTATKLGAAYQADQFPGADFGAKLQACLNAVDPTYGGTCDARNFTGTQSMGSNLTISTANTTVELPCATIATANQVIVTAGTRNVSLRGCALRGGSAADGSVGGTVFQYSGTGPMVQVGDPAYLADTPGFHLDNVDINTTGATSATAQGLAAYRTQEMDVESVYLLGNANQTGMTLDGTGNYTGGTFFDNAFNGFLTAVNAIGHQAANAATTDWLNASTFVRLHIVCPTSGGYPIAGTTGINLQQGDGNTFTGGDVEGCATALHLGPNAQNNTIMGMRNENSTNQVVADAGSAYNNWITGGTMFTGKLADSGTRNSFLDTFHRSFNGMNGDWYGSQQDATVTNHYRLGTGTGNERGLQNRYQTDYGYRWTTGLTDATSGEQFYQIRDELNNVNRISAGQYLTATANSVTNVVMNNGGCYSSNAAPTVSFSGGGGSGAAGTANMVVSSCSGGWTVGSVTMTNNGSGYTSQPAIAWSGGAQISAPNAIAEITIAGSTNNQTVLNSAGTGAVVLNGSNNAGTGGVVFGSGGPSETTVATINNAGNAQFNGTLQVGGTSTFTGSATVKNQADAEIDSILQAGLTASQKESLIYRDFTGASQWYMVKDQSNNWALNSATGNLDSFKAYQSTNSGDTYVNASKSTGVVRVNYEAGSGTAFNIYGGSSTNLYASFGAANAIRFPGLAASSGSNCVQIDNSGYISNTGSPCGSGSSGSGTVGSGTLGQIAYYTASGTTLGGMSAVPISAGGTGATTAAALNSLVPGANSDSNGNLTVNSVSETNSAVVKATSYGLKNDNLTDIGSALQAAWNAMPANGQVVLNCKSPGCYWSDPVPYDATLNPSGFNWGSKGGTLVLEGTINSPTSFTMPENQAVNLVCAGAQTSQAQFATGYQRCSWNTTTPQTTLNTAVTTADGTKTTVTLTLGSVAGIQAGPCHGGSCVDTGGTDFYQGTMLTFADTTTCNITSVVMNGNQVTAQLSAACDIPPRVGVSVAGVANALFNGSHRNGYTGGPFIAQDADNELNTITWEAYKDTGAWAANHAYLQSDAYSNAGTEYYVTTAYTSGASFGSTDTANTVTFSTTAPTYSTGGTVTGLREDSLEDASVEAVNTTNKTVTVTLYRSHIANGTVINGVTETSQVAPAGIWVYGNNQSNVLRGVNSQASGDAFVIDDYLGYFHGIATVQTGACSGILTAGAAAVRVNGSYDHIDDGAALDAYCTPEALHIYAQYNAGYASAGPVYIDNSVIEGVKADHGGGSVYVKNSTCDRCARGVVTFDPTNYWNGNATVVSEHGVLFNDNPDNFAGYDYYQTTKGGTCPTVDVNGNYGSRLGVNAYACLSKTNVPTFSGNRNQQPQGLIGTFNNGRQIDGNVRGIQASFAPAVVPYPTANIPGIQSWTGVCTSVPVVGPDGSSTSASAFTYSTVAGSDNQTVNIGTPIVGEVVLFGGLAYSPTPGQSVGTTGFSSAISVNNNSSLHYSLNYQTTAGFQNVDSYDAGIANDWWHEISGMALVTQSDGTASQNVQMRAGCDNTRTMEYAYPWLIDVKPIQTTGTFSAGGTSITLASGSGIVNGMEILNAAGSFLPGTIVASGGGTTTITVPAAYAALQAGSGVTLTFQYPMSEIARWKTQLLHGYVPSGATAGSIYYNPALALKAGTLTIIPANPTAQSVATAVVDGQTINPGKGSSTSLKPATTDNVQYVSNSGNDSNDGLSWGTAKLTVAAACASLPGGGSNCGGGYGTVYVAPSFTGSTIVPPINLNSGFPTFPTIVYLPSTGRTITLGSTAFPVSTSGLQAAITAVCASGAGTILIPEVQLFLSSTIDISNCPLQIIGSGVDSLIYNNTGSTASFLIDHDNSVVIRNLAFNVTSNGPGIEFTSPAANSNSGVTIADSWFAGATPGDTTGSQVAIEFNANLAGHYASIDGIFSNLHFSTNLVAFKTIGGNAPAGEGNQWSNIDVQTNSGLTVSPIQSNDNSEIWSNVRFENPLAAGVPAFAASGSLNTINIICDTQTACVSDTGVANKWNVTFISGSFGTKAASSSMWVGDVTKSTTYFIPAVETLASFPACTSAIQGAAISVTDSTTQTWGATAAGGGSLPAKLYCDGTNYTVTGK
jgi:hypothetical protein